MGPDGAALVRLWREKRGGGAQLVGQSHHIAGGGHGALKSAVVRKTTAATLDGTVERTTTSAMPRLRE
jgi:hypothetical protein